ncbi:MAG: CehA/McbA family metallohydrolase [Armatimonadetes bacterium]|nr:CehA/McbA family metallohydrolase [Armatimonadota bacterium]
MRLSIWTLLLFIAWNAAHAQEARYAYPGAIHVHTTYSDGSGSFKEVAAAAKAAGLKFVITTDHNTLLPFQKGNERYWGSVLVLVDAEVTTDSGHLLALGVPGSFKWDATTPQPILQAVRKAGGMAFIAHPMAESWRWTDWKVTGYTGIEVINLAALVDDDLRTAMHAKAPRRSLNELLKLARLYASKPDAVLNRWTDNPVEPELKLWDRLLSEGKKVVGIASVDAHARIEAGGKILKIPSYRQAFEAVATYILTPKPLTGNLEQDKALVYDALRNGRLYMAYTQAGSAPDFGFTAREGGRAATIGQTLKLEKEALFRIFAPKGRSAYLRLIRNGREVAATEGPALEYRATQPGAYRAEAHLVKSRKRTLKLPRRVNKETLGDLLKKRPDALRPWIFSNPIYIEK